MSKPCRPLTNETLSEAVVILSSRDSLLNQLASQYGAPPLWQRPQNFATLVHVVLEQKVSLTSARAVMARVRHLCPGMQPADFLALPEQRLREAGISEQKMSYCRSIALAIVQNQLNLARLRRLSDEGIMQALTAIRGIGPWTAGIYLLMALRRPDAWASGDRALVVSLAECEALEVVPSHVELDRRAEAWRPYRGAAARLLWHAYLSRRADMAHK